VNRRHLLTALTLLTLTACTSTPAQHVALPPADASPQDVVRAYVAALNAHDLDTAKRMLTARRAAVVASTQDGWFTNLVSITDLTVADPVPRAAADLSRQDYREVTYLPVEFTLRQRHAESMPDGHTGWGFTLVRNSDTERWLIDDEGVG
jgi:hypothetical protein